MKIHVPPACVLPPFTALFVSGRRRVEGGPAKELNQKDPDQSAQAVKAYVPDPGRTAGHKGLMIFIQPGKSHADDPGKKKQPQSSDAIYIKWKRNSNGKQTVFCHVCGLADVVMNLLCLVCKLFIAFSGIEKFVFGFYDLVADSVAEIPGHLPGLGRK